MLIDNNDILIYQPNEELRLEVKLSGETVWLSTGQMALLFDREESNIRRHIINVFKEGELTQENNVQKIHVNGVKKPVPFYTLDVIISVGYRVKSKQGTLFRQWANRVLKEHLLHGYSVSNHLIAMQQQMDNRFSVLEQEVKKHGEQIDFLVRTKQKSSEEIFPAGCIFDAWNYVSGLVRNAQKRIILIDNYCDERVLGLLTKRKEGVVSAIYTRYSLQFKTDLEKHNKQYSPIEFVQLSQKSHDRFLIIDDDVYLLGSSVKDMGNGLCAITKMQATADEIIKFIK